MLLKLVKVRQRFTVQHVIRKRNLGVSYLLQPGAEAHVAQVVGEEGAWAVGWVPSEEQQAEEGHVAAGLHAPMQLGRSGQHQ